MLYHSITYYPPPLTTFQEDGNLGASTGVRVPIQHLWYRYTMTYYTINTYTVLWCIIVYYDRTCNTILYYNLKLHPPLYPHITTWWYRCLWNRHSLYRSRSPAIQQQKLLSSPRLGVCEAYPPTCPHLQIVFLHRHRCPRSPPGVESLRSGSSRASSRVSRVHPPNKDHL